MEESMKRNREHLEEKKKEANVEDFSEMMSKF
jgi:hypothetical protein